MTSEKKPAGEAAPAGPGRLDPQLLTLLREARARLADPRLHYDELDRRKRGETIQEHEDRISDAMQQNEDLRRLCQELDDVLAGADLEAAAPLQTTPAANDEGLVVLDLRTRRPHDYVLVDLRSKEGWKPWRDADGEWRWISASAPEAALAAPQGADRR